MTFVCTKANENPVMCIKILSVCIMQGYKATVTPVRQALLLRVNGHDGAPVNATILPVS